VLDDIAKNNN